MLLFTISILFLSSGVNSLDSYQGQKRSAASDAQIRFAIENKYDQTGPGANGREYAYNTYRTLDDALVGYLDDPDTKLPEYEKAKGTAKLYEHQAFFQKSNQRPLFLSGGLSEKNSLFNKANIDIQAKAPFDYHGYNLGILTKSFEEKPKLDPFRFQKVMSVKGSPLNLAHFTRDPQELSRDFNPNPHYTFSYGVHDKQTGDSKAAQESRTGGTVHGFYSFLDADGKQRTVQYTADDDQGFRAVVRRTATNAQ